MALMDEFRTAGMYDRALKVGEEWLSRHPDDGLMYAQMALVYLQKARANPEDKDSLATEAVKKAHRAVELDPKDFLVLQFSVIAFETAASISEVDRCIRYGNAVKIIDHWKFWVDDEARIRAKDPSAPDRRKLQRDLVEWRQAIKEKAAKALCRDEGPQPVT